MRIPMPKVGRACPVYLRLPQESYSLFTKFLTEASPIRGREGHTLKPCVCNSSGPNIL